MPYQEIRIYLRDEAAAVSPAYPTTSGGSAQAIRIRGALTRGTSAFTSRGLAGITNGVWNAIQIVSDPLSLAAPMWALAGLVRGSITYAVAGSPGTTPSLQRAFILPNIRFCSADGLTYRTTGNQEISEFADFPPTLYGGHLYLDSTTLRAQSLKRAADWGTAPPSITYTGLTSIQSGDRAVITLQVSAFSPSGAGAMSAAIEYGENSATPLDHLSVDTAGHPFIALYVWREKLERFDPEQSYTRFRGAAHSAERFVLGATPSTPYLGVMFLGE